MGGPSQIRGSTTILELIRRFPDGRALKLMSDLGWPCAYCGAREHEPLSLAAKRHGNPAGHVITCFRALETGDVDADLIRRAQRPERPASDPDASWRAFALRYRN